MEVEAAWSPSFFITLNFFNFLNNQSKNNNTYTLPFFIGFRFQKCHPTPINYGILNIYNNIFIVDKSIQNTFISFIN
jgi:hypothetical protein